MKRLLILASLAVSGALALNAQIAVQADRYMPLNGTPNEEPAGYAVELMVEVFGSATYTLQPWNEALSATTKGKSDAVIGAAKDEAPDLIFPSEPVGHIDYGLFARADFAFTYSDEALKSCRVAVIKGYTYWPALDALIAANAPNLTIFTGPNALSDAVAALHAGTIDLFPESKPVFAWAVQEQELNPDSFVSKHDQDGGFVYIAFSKTERGAKLAAQWDERIKALRANGQVGATLARYNVPDWAAAN